MLGAVLDDINLVSNVSIVPRGNIGGFTNLVPLEKKVKLGQQPNDHLLNRICLFMGGRIAEEILYGKDKVTSGSQNDF